MAFGVYSGKTKTFRRPECKAEEALGDLHGFSVLVWLGMPWQPLAAFGWLGRPGPGELPAATAATQKPFGDLNVKQKRYLET